MAIQTIATFCVLIIFLASCEAKPENCSEAQCQLLPVGEGFASEFRLKSSEKGVRMVYFHLKIGNDSYHPLDSPKLFLPERWVWANSISEAMLSFSFDYDVLSLGLLTYQVRSIDAPLVDQPSGCLAKMDLSCQNKVVAKVLLNNTAHSSDGTDIVCVKSIVKMNDNRARFLDGNIIYKCCERTKRGLAEESSIQCELHVKSSVWFKIFYGILNVFTWVMVFYCPALLLALPDFIINLRKEYEVAGTRADRRDRIVPEDTSGRNASISEDIVESTCENRIYFMDDTSPITCSNLFKFLAKELPLSCSFRARLAFLSYCIMPLVFYIDLGLNYTTKRDIFYELTSKPQAILGWHFFMSKILTSYLVVLSVFLLPVFFIVAVRPKIFRRDGKCCFCNESDLFLGEDILKHLEKMPEQIYNLMSCLIKLHKRYLVKCLKRLPWLDCDFTGHYYCLPCILIVVSCDILYYCVSVAFFGLFLGAVYFCVSLAGSLLLILLYSPLVCVIFALLSKFFNEFITTQCDTCWNCTVLYFLYYLWANLKAVPLLWGFPVVSLIGASSCRFIVRMFGFIIMGLVLNAEIAGPFVTFFIAATGNMYLCYYNLQTRYQDVKQMISQKWQEHRHLLDNDADLSDAETIPAELFWYICGDESNCKNKVLPVRPEIFRMILNMVLISLFLFLSLCAIIFLGNMHSISGVVSTIAVFVTGVIPGLFFKGLTKEKRFIGLTRRGMMNKIEKAVKEYIDMARA